MTTSLIETTAGLTTTDLFQNDSAQGRVDKIRVEALAEVFDVTTAAGRKLCISQAGKVAKTKTAVDKLGKALSDSLNVERSGVMTDRRIYNDGFSELKIEVRQPVTDWEAAEVEKLAKVQQAFEHLVTNSEAHNITGELFSDVVLQAKLEKLEACDVADFDHIRRHRLEQTKTFVLAWNEKGTKIPDRGAFRTHFLGGCLGRRGRRGNLLGVEAGQVTLNYIIRHHNPFVEPVKNS